jgi:hypothetical protein
VTETEWSADGTKWLPVPVIDGADDGDRWHWKVQGTAESHGTIWHGWEGEGIVQARTSAEALVWLAADGPIYGYGLDFDEEFTITISPAKTEA